MSDSGAAALAWRQGTTVIAGAAARRHGRYGPVVPLRSAEAGTFSPEPGPHHRVRRERGRDLGAARGRVGPHDRPRLPPGLELRTRSRPSPTTPAAVLGNTTAGNDGVGNVMVAAPNGNTDKIDVQTGDFGGPEQRALVAPATVERGVATTFSFSPFDRQSSLGPSRWVFSDDGAAVQAPRAAHTFRKAGSFTARSITTDGVGNVRDTANAVRVVDTRKPSISRLSLSRARFRIGAKRVPVAAQKRRRRRSARLAFATGSPRTRA